MEILGGDDSTLLRGEEGREEGGGEGGSRSHDREEGREKTRLFRAIISYLNIS